jgi:hypothetical protein
MHHAIKSGMMFEPRKPGWKKVEKEAKYAQHALAGEYLTSKKNKPDIIHCTQY